MKIKLFVLLSVFVALLPMGMTFALEKLPDTGQTTSYVDIQSEDADWRMPSILSTEGRAMAAQGVVLTSPDGTIRSDTLLTDIFLTPSTLNEKGI